MTHVIGKLAVTSKSSRNCTILAGITVLYLVNVMGGYMQLERIMQAIRTGGKPRGDNPQADDILNNIVQDLPLIVADGLLVREL